MSTDDPTTEPPTGTPAPDHAPVQRYEIRVDGRLGARWEAWFDGMALASGDDGTTVLTGPIADQAALHGVLQKLRDLGVGLRSLTQLETGDQPDGHHDRPLHHAPGAPS